MAIGSSVAKSQDPSQMKYRRVFARNAVELLTLSGTGQAQRSEILPFRNAEPTRMSRATLSTPTEKQDNNEFYLIKARVQAHIAISSSVVK